MSISFLGWLQSLLGRVWPVVADRPAAAALTDLPETVAMSVTIQQIDVTIHIYGAENMSQFAAQLQKLTAAVESLEAATAAEAAQSAAEFSALKTQVAELQAKLDAGVATPEELELFSQLSQRVADQAAKVAAIVPDAPPAPVEPTA